MHQIFDVSDFIVTIKACVHVFYFCSQDKTFSKNYQKCFLLYQKISFSPRDYQIFYFSLSLFLSFLAIADFVEEVDWW